MPVDLDSWVRHLVAEFCWTCSPRYVGESIYKSADYVTGRPEDLASSRLSDIEAINEVIETVLAGKVECMLFLGLHEMLKENQD